jgi:hypothetical protein
MVSIWSRWILNSDTLNLLGLPGVLRQEFANVYGRSWSSIYVARIEPYYATPDLGFGIENLLNRDITPYQLSL